MIPDMANMKCDFEIGYQTDSYIFDFDFIPKGNFTTTWGHMVSIFVVYITYISA